MTPGDLSYPTIRHYTFLGLFFRLFIGDLEIDYLDLLNYTQMSLRENIQVFHHIEPDKYLDVLKEAHNAQDHPSQLGSFLIDEAQPFYAPQQIKDHISILGFNYIPLPDQLIQVLIDHPDLAPDNTLVRWTQEQDLILETTLGELRKTGDR